MKSIAKRLEPFKEKVVKCAKEMGRYQALCLARELADVRDYGCFQRWLVKETHDENFGLCPTNPTALADSPWFKRQKLHQTLDYLLGNIQLIQKLQAENEELATDFKSELRELIETEDPALLGMETKEFQALLTMKT